MSASSSEQHLPNATAMVSGDQQQLISTAAADGSASTPIAQQQQRRGSNTTASNLPLSTVKADLNAVRESYFAAVVGRSPAPPRQTYIPMTPRRGMTMAANGGVGPRQPTTGDPILDGNNNNLQHKARAADSTDMVLSTSSGLLATIAANRDRLVQHLGKSTENTQTFNDEFKWYTPKGYDLKDVTKRGELKLAVETIADRWLKRSRHAPQSVLVPLLDQLSAVEAKVIPTATTADSTPHSGDGAIAVVAAGSSSHKNVPKRMSRTALLDATDILKGVDFHVDTTIPLKNSSHWEQLPKPTLSEVLLAHHDYLHADVRSQAKEELDRTNADLDRLTKQSQLLQSDVDLFLSQERYAEVEDRLKQLLNVEAMAIEIGVKRINCLDMRDVDASEFAKEKDQLLTDTDDILAKFRRDKDRAAADVGFDMRRCAELRQKIDLRIADVDDLYTKNESDIIQRLKLNEKHHMEIYTEIMERAKILEKLSEDRRQMVMGTMRAREDRDREVFEQNELKDRISEYEGLLNQVQSYLRDELSLCDVLDAHSGTMADYLNNRSFNDDIEDIKFAELTKLRQIYGEFVANSGSLVTKKQHRFDTIERQIRLARLQKETAKDALDPDVTGHQSKLIELSDLLQTTETAIMNLESQQDAVETIVAKPLAELEILSNQRNVAFRHPSEITAAVVVAERRAFVERTQQFVDEEAIVVMKRKEALQQARRQNEIEHAEHVALALSPPPLPSSPMVAKGSLASATANRAIRDAAVVAATTPTTTTGVEETKSGGVVPEESAVVAKAIEYEEEL